MAKKSKIKEEEGKPEISKEVSLEERQAYANQVVIKKHFELYNRPDTQAQIEDLIQKMLNGTDGVFPIDKQYSREEIEKAIEDYWKIKIKELPEKTVRVITPDEAEEIALHQLRENYWIIREILHKYMDMTEENQIIVALWIIGTYLHKEFNSFPFLFVNAMRGSGKTRLLQIIEALCDNGKLTNNMSEAVLFRTAEKNTMLVDELENVGKKEQEVLRGLFNSAYKKGAIVQRMQKKHTKEGEVQEVQTFNLYTPIAMANIWGMNDVLGDRCIHILLEKSDDPKHTKLLQDFTTNEMFHALKGSFNTIKCSLCSVVTKKKCISEWNNYVDVVYNYTPTYITYTTLTTLTAQKNNVIDDSTSQLFQKIDAINVDSRNLELYFPLFIIAKMVGDDVLDVLLKITEAKVKEKLEEDVIENIDVSLFDFISRKESNLQHYLINDLVYDFKNFVQGDDEENKWINARWMGRALKRLSLIRSKRRVSKGVEVMLDTNKAKEKLKIFKKEECKQEVLQQKI